MTAMSHEPGSGGFWCEVLKEGDAGDAAQALHLAVVELRTEPSILRARLLLARLGRQVAATPLGPTLALAAFPGAAKAPFDGADLLARVGLVVESAHLVKDGAPPGVVTALFRTGGDREQIAVMRALPWLPLPQQWVELAREASRTNHEQVFSALSCDNPFVAAHLPDDAFFQLVLKCLFMGVPIGQILGLRSRVTPELVRMASDYALERKAAARPVPEDAIRLTELLAHEPTSSGPGPRIHA